MFIDKIERKKWFATVEIRVIKYFNISSFAEHDECSDDSQDCSANAYCTNTVGSYECHCKYGYTDTHNFLLYWYSKKLWVSL